MENLDRKDLMNKFSYCFSILNTVNEFQNAIKAEQQKARDLEWKKYGKNKVIAIVATIVLFLICLNIGLLIGKKDGPMLSFIMFMIFLGIGLRIYKNYFVEIKANNAYSNAAKNNISQQYRNQARELLSDSYFVQCRNLIPESVFNINDLYLMYSYLEEYRANNFKEAINLLREEQHRQKVVYNQEVIKEMNRSIEGNTRYIAALNTLDFLTRKR